MNGQPHVLQNITGRLLLSQYSADEIEEPAVVSFNELQKCCPIAPLGKTHSLLLISTFWAHFHPAVAFLLTGMQTGRLALPHGSKRFRKA